ncbi:hypothetical protein, partial [Zooshikella harenae]
SPLSASKYCPGKRRFKVTAIGFISVSKNRVFEGRPSRAEGTDFSVKFWGGGLAMKLCLERRSQPAKWSRKYGRLIFSLTV